MIGSMQFVPHLGRYAFPGPAAVVVEPRSISSLDLNVLIIEDPVPDLDLVDEIAVALVEWLPRQEPEPLRGHRERARGARQSRISGPKSSDTMHCGAVRPMTSTTRSPIP